MNISALETWGLRCPECGGSDDIDIAATVWVRLCRDGTDPTLAACGDHEWGDDSSASCDGYGHQATVSAFQGRQA